MMSNPYMSMAKSNAQTMRQGGMFGTNYDLASLEMENRNFMDDEPYDVPYTIGEKPFIPP